jgi:hypothetical protein
LISVTTGVAAALIQDMGALYSVTTNGMPKSVMFIGSGSLGVVVKAVIP